MKWYCEGGTETCHNCDVIGNKILVEFRCMPEAWCHTNTRSALFVTILIAVGWIIGTRLYMSRPQP